jgi:hypothetical protein
MSSAYKKCWTSEFEPQFVSYIEREHVQARLWVVKFIWQIPDHSIRTASFYKYMGYWGLIKNEWKANRWLPDFIKTKIIPKIPRKHTFLVRTAQKCNIFFKFITEFMKKFLPVKYIILHTQNPNIIYLHFNHGQNTPQPSNLFIRLRSIAIAFHAAAKYLKLLKLKFQLVLCTWYGGAFVGKQNGVITPLSALKIE